MGIKAKNFSRVAPHLYRGGLPSPADLRAFKDLGIRTVVDFNRKGHPLEKVTAEKLGLKYIHKPWTAWWHHSLIWNYYFNITEEFLKYAQDKSLWPMYVHCYHGRDRTGMLIGAYRMIFEGWSFMQALGEMRKFGFNPVFHFDLVLFLMRYRKRCTLTQGGCK